MKKAPIIILITVIFLSSCEFLSQLTEFDLPYETTVSIPLIVASDSALDITTPTINTGITDAMDQYNTGLDLIEEVTLTSMTLTVSSPMDGDFGFLESIEIFISASGMDELQLAYETSVAADAGSVLELQTTAQDLQDYIKLDDFSLRFNIATDETVLTEHEIVMNMEVHVNAKVLGL